ncbi:MAG: tail fiber domain-containing protein [Verrucomicrobiales bacterium]|nr:tail fiber domain-containing protein [Verrucomicrobiales bacterium]
MLGFLFLGRPSLVAAEPPGIINHQGRIAISGVNHSGPGYFKFALVDATGATTYWSNDGTSVAGSEPAAAVETPVASGHYSIPLGDTSYHSNMKGAIPKTVFTENSDVRLAIWFGHTPSSFQKLSPNRRIASAAYALSAGSGVAASGSIGSEQIADGSVSASDLANGAVGAMQLAEASVTSDKVAAGAIGTSQLAAGSVTSAQLADGQVTTPKLAANAVTGAKILDGSIEAADLAAGSVTSGKIANGAVGAAQLAAGSVGSTQLADGEVGNADLADDAVSTMKIADAAVTGAKIAMGAIGTSQLAAGSVTSVKIANGAVGAAQIAPDSIGADQLADGSVTAAEIANNAVTTAKIADAAVTGAKVASGAIGTSQLAAASVTSGKIANGAVGTAQLAAGSVGSTQLADGSVTASKIANGALTGAMIAPGSLGSAAFDSSIGLWTRAGADVVRPTGNVGIGTAAPTGLFEVHGEAVLGAETLDQEVLTPASATHLNWQSFTAGHTGRLTRIELKVGSPLGSSSSAGTIRIYAGEGLGGTVLATQSVTFAVVPQQTYQAFTLSTSVAIASGEKYTIGIEVPQVDFSWMYFDPGNPYAGGRSDISGWDLGFRTHVTPVSSEAIVMVKDGRLGVGVDAPEAKLHVKGGVLFASGGTGANQGVSWTPGSASWSFTSDRHTKEAIEPVDPGQVLDRLLSVPIAEWNYIGHGQRHIGPMAQDFHAAFPLNESDTTLNDADLHGVALAAIQGLHGKLEEREAALLRESEALRGENAALRERLEALEKTVGRLATALGQP